MPNRQLTSDELEKLADPLLKAVVEHLADLSGGDPELLFALRRKLAKELSYAERGKPMLRVRLKMKKRIEQLGRCKLCSELLPERGAILDRIAAMDGYTAENTRLLCPGCDAKLQHERGYQ
jgi:hypothetical protein